MGKPYPLDFRKRVAAAVVTGRLSCNEAGKPPRQNCASAHPLRRSQASFFLPKYSPDLDPIEQVFAKLKHFLRKAAARTVFLFASQSARLSSTSRPKNALSYFTNSGYG